MEKIFLSADGLGRVKKNFKKLEKALKINLTLSENSAAIKAKEPFDEYIAAEIIKAVDFGFTPEKALQLQNVDFVFRKIDIKAGTRRISATIARIIGKGGKTKKALENVSQCGIVLRGHLVGIIGKSEHAELLSKAILAIIRGASSTKALSRLEKDMAKLEEEDVERYIK